MAAKSKSGNKPAKSDKPSKSKADKSEKPADDSTKPAKSEATLAPAAKPSGDGKPIKVILPDGSEKEHAAGVSLREVAEAIGPGLAKKAVGAVVADKCGNGADHARDNGEADDEEGGGRFDLADGKVVDLTHILDADAHVRILTDRDAEALPILHHSTAHVMADAIRRLWPGTKLWVGPPITEPWPGFYYDIECPHQISDDDLPKIEEEMKKIVNAKSPFVKRWENRAQAIKHFEKDEPDPYKVDLLNRFDDDEVSFYRHGESFEDLCRGPHVPSTGFIKAFKLMKVAGAYWKGDANNQMLQRIYGTSFFSKDDLKALLGRIEEAEKRDHRRLGKELDLFSFNEYSPAMPFFHPRGVAMLNAMIAFSREEHRRRGYVEIQTPQVLVDDLWRISGHLDNYVDNMYFTHYSEKEIEHGATGDEDREHGRRFGLKPMNCPGCMLYYRSKHHSYNEFPLRIAEFGRVHRKEKSGVTHGLLRVKAFTQDDAHIFVTPDMLEDEILRVLDFVFFLYEAFGFSDLRLELSTRPEKSIGSDEDWNTAESSLQGALERCGKPWKLNPQDGAFYGPKIDCHIRDAIGRSWQLGTIQVDFALPKRFELKYTTREGNPAQPIMLHRAVFGSIERFFGILIENWAGAFPTWLAPMQAYVLTVTDKQIPYAREIIDALGAHGLRADGDLSSERIGKKIAMSAKMKAPYVLIIGEQEQQARSVNLRPRENPQQQESMPLAAFIEKLAAEAKPPHKELAPIA